MRCFQRAKEVLDEFYVQIPLRDESRKDALIRNKLSLLRRQYEKLKSGEAINYNSLSTRFAYYYRYVPAHANVVCQLINRNDVLAQSFNRNSLSISCLGGGPGSEFWGILRYRELSHKSTHIFCDMYDKERIWSDLWSTSRISKKVKTSPYLFPSFKCLDITDVDSYERQYNLRHADLFIMSFFMSEVYSERRQSDIFFKNLFDNAKRGALFLFIDNTTGSSHLWFDDIVENHNRQHTYSYMKFLDRSNFLKFDVCECSNEKMEDLGIFYEKFGRCDSLGRREVPRRHVCVSYRVCIKQ